MRRTISTTRSWRSWRISTRKRICADSGAAVRQ
jgi:hypothetical protein